jgi:hypothetical protein
MNVDVIMLRMNGVSICRCSACGASRGARLVNAMREKFGAHNRSSLGAGSCFGTTRNTSPRLHRLAVGS